MNKKMLAAMEADMSAIERQTEALEKIVAARSAAAIAPRVTFAERMKRIDGHKVELERVLDRLTSKPPVLSTHEERMDALDDIERKIDQRQWRKPMTIAERRERYLVSGI